jgi:hypothetical protein
MKPIFKVGVCDIAFVCLFEFVAEEKSPLAAPCLFFQEGIVSSVNPFLRKVI